MVIRDWPSAGLADRRPQSLSPSGPRQRSQPLERSSTQRRTEAVTAAPPPRFPIHLSSVVFDLHAGPSPRTRGPGRSIPHVWRSGRGFGGAGTVVRVPAPRRKKSRAPQPRSTTVALAKDGSLDLAVSEAAPRLQAPETPSAA